MAAIFRLHRLEKEAAQVLLSYAYLYDDTDGDSPEELLSMAREYQRTRRMREASQREAQQKPNRFKYQSKTQLIYEYINNNPGCRTHNISKDLDIDVGTVRATINWLRIHGAVKPVDKRKWGRYYPTKRTT